MRPFPLGPIVTDAAAGADPCVGMATILGRGAMNREVGTEVCRGQGSDWWYTSPDSGLCVFVRSHNRTRILSERLGYITSG